MPMIDPAASQLLLIDFQERLLPAIHDGESAVRNAVILAKAARILTISTLRTEQYPTGLGPSVKQIQPYGSSIEKITFSCCEAPAFMAALQGGTAIVAGCEAHVCVLQTVLGLRQRGHAVAVVADAVGSRAPANKQLALERMARAGADIVSTEMVIFEWLGSARHPQFRALSALIR